MEESQKAEKKKKTSQEKWIFSQVKKTSWRDDLWKKKEKKIKQKHFFPTGEGRSQKKIQVFMVIQWGQNKTLSIVIDGKIQDLKAFYEWF